MICFEMIDDKGHEIHVVTDLGNVDFWTKLNV